MAMAAVSVGTNATLIVTANPSRKSILISNNDATATLFIGDSSVTTANGIPLAAGMSFIETSGGNKLWGGAIYGIVASSTLDTHYWERI